MEFHDDAMNSAPMRSSAWASCDVTRAFDDSCLLNRRNA